MTLNSEGQTSERYAKHIYDRGDFMAVQCFVTEHEVNTNSFFVDELETFQVNTPKAQSSPPKRFESIYCSAGSDSLLLQHGQYCTYDLHNTPNLPTGGAGGGL